MPFDGNDLNAIIGGAVTGNDGAAFQARFRETIIKSIGAVLTRVEMEVGMDGVSLAMEWTGTKEAKDFVQMAREALPLQLEKYEGDIWREMAQGAGMTPPETQRRLGAGEELVFKSRPLAALFSHVPFRNALDAENAVIKTIVAHHVLAKNPQLTTDRFRTVPDITTLPCVDFLAKQYELLGFGRQKEGEKPDGKSIDERCRELAKTYARKIDHSTQSHLAKQPPLVLT